MRYIFPFIILLFLIFSGCEKNKENESDGIGQGEYESSAYSSNSESEAVRVSEIVTDTECGFGEIYITD